MRTQRMQYILISLFFLAASALSGCSRGGSDQAAGSPPSGATVSATVAARGELKLATAGTPNTIAGIDLKVNLPAGVSVNADPVTGEVASGVVAISGAAAAGANNLVVARYVPGTDRAPAQLHIAMLNLAGFPLGEFVTIKFDQTAAGELPASDAFTVANFSAKGIDGSTLSGIHAAPLSVEVAGNAAIRTLVTVFGTPAILTITVDTPTRFTTQTIIGTVSSGATLTVTASAPAVVSGLTITGAAWSALVSGLAQGVNTILATAVSGTVVVTATATILVDQVPPFINIDTTLVTQNDSIGISGSAEINSKITVTCDHATADTVFFSDPGANITRWSAMILGLVEGVNHCAVTAIDMVGLVTVKKAEITRDSTPPSLSISATTPAKTGSAETITGTVEAGATTPAVTANTAATVGPVSVTGSTWSCTVSGLPAGDTAVSVTAKDAAGNVTTKTATITAYNSTGSFTGASQPTVTDALKALRYAVGLDVPTPVDIIYGDLYADNLIDIADAVLILEKAVGLFDNVLGFNNLYPHLLSSPQRREP